MTTNNLNLQSGDSITLKLNTANDTLSIEINKAGLDRILKDLENDTGSVLKAILDRLTALENHTTGATEEWVKSLIDKYAVNTTNGLVDYGPDEPASGANSRAKIYVKYE